MRLGAAIEILTRMHKSAHGDKAAALGTALVSLKEDLERVQDEVEEAIEMLDHILPGPDAPDRWGAATTSVCRSRGIQ